MESYYHPGQLICLKLIKGLAIHIQFITLKENRYLFQFQVSIGSEIFVLKKMKTEFKFFLKSAILFYFINSNNMMGK